MAPLVLSLVLDLDTAVAAAEQRLAPCLEMVALAILAAAVVVAAESEFPLDLLLAHLAQVELAALVTFSSYQCKENQ